jgi:hypothetical protein
MGSASIGYQFGISARFYGNFNLSSDITVSSLPCKLDVSIKSLFSAPSSTHKVKDPSLFISLNLVYANNTKVPNFQSGSRL